jgi:hypothetical protein
VVVSRADWQVIPPDNHWSGAYEWMIVRAQRALESGGVIDGLIFHQGESDNTDDAWLNKVKEVVDDLHADLALGDIPFVAGELLYGSSGFNGKRRSQPIA